jgi:serine/threonine protein kinase
MSLRSQGRQEIRITGRPTENELILSLSIAIACTTAGSKDTRPHRFISASSQRASQDTLTAVDEQHLTSPRSTLGAVADMSPEQVHAKQRNLRSDLFVVRCLLYSMATGTLPFRGESSAVIFEAILDAPLISACRDANRIRHVRSLRRQDPERRLCSGRCSWGFPPGAETRLRCSYLLLDGG